MLLTLLLLNQPFPNQATPTPILCSRPGFCVSPVDKGEPAPFAGQLLSPMRAIELGNVAADCPKRISLEVRTATQTLALKDGRNQDLLQIDLNAVRVENELLSKEVSKLSSWWREPALWLAAGLAVAGIIIAVAK